jgi:hypothetical protein
MTVPIIAGVDPNSQFAGSELAVVARAAQDLQNKHLTIGKLGEVADGLHRAVLNITDQAARVAVTDDDTYARAGALLKVVKTVLASGETERKAITAPILSLKETVDTLFKFVVGSPLSEVGKAVEGKMLAYVKEKRAREAAAAAIRQKEIEDAARRQAELARAMEDDETADAVLEAAKELAAEAAPKQAAVESHGVKTQVATRKVVVVRDLRLALAYILKGASDSELAAITSLNARALSSFVARSMGGELQVVSGSATGIDVTEVDSIRNY